jgi:hypothetical protein
MLTDDQKADYMVNTKAVSFLTQGCTGIAYGFVEVCEQNAYTAWTLFSDQWETSDVGTDYRTVESSFNAVKLDTINWSPTSFLGSRILQPASRRD